tara:strand:- start:1046 stop:1855 length:810 start_codon:yes stop_codon:yes gene_type:complete
MAVTYDYDATKELESKGQVLEFYQTFSGATVNFKAFLTTYTDDFRCNWVPTRVFGRPDPIQTYQGTERSLNLAWKIPAYSLEDAESNLIKTSTLARMLYPEYSAVDNANTISKGPLVKVKFSNLIYDASRGPGGDVRTNGLLGVIKSLNWRPELKDGFFDPDTRLYPKLITLTIGFGVLHQHTLGWEKREAELVSGDSTRGEKLAGKGKLGDVNSGRESAAQLSAPVWGSDASLFPWSVAVRKTTTDAGVGTPQEIKQSIQNDILGSKK